MYKNKAIIILLRVALDIDCNVDYNVIKNTDWYSLFKEAKEQCLLSLIYVGVIKLKLKNSIDKSLLEKWKEGILQSTMNEVKQQQNLKELLKKCNEEHLEVVALKGSILKELYPNKELRTMSDIDILVKKKEFSLGCTLLESMGYKKACEENKHKAHEVFIRNHQSIELHWKLINHDYLKTLEFFDATIWNNTKEILIDGEKALTLNYEYELVHIISHMAIHIICSSFGIRQLIDLYLYLKTYDDTINWNNVRLLLSKSSLITFTNSLFIIIDDLFNYKIKSYNELFDGLYIDLSTDDIHKLTNCIFDGGIFGKNNKVTLLSSNITNHKSSNNSSNIRFIKILFPGLDDITWRYEYLNSYKFLLPIAWVQNSFRRIFDPNFTMKEKLGFIFKSVSISNAKEEMLKNLKLR